MTPLDQAPAASVEETSASLEGTNSEGKLLPMKNSSRDKVRQMVWRQLDRMLSLEPKVLRGDNPGAIHDFRVASRRFQQALNLLSPPSAAPKVRRIGRKVRRCRRACSAVRNCDVFIERIEKLLAGETSRYREAWAAVLDHVRERRQKAHARALGKLSKLNLAGIYVELRPALSSDAAVPEGKDALNADTLDEPLDDRMREELDRANQRFRAQAAHFQSGSGADDSLHELRLAAKKLRYLVEIADELEVQDSHEALGWLRKAQQHLGDCHDLEVAQQMMAKMAAHPRFLREQLGLAMLILKLMSREQKAKERLEQKYTEWFLSTGGGEALNGWLQAFLASRNEAG